MNYSLRVEITKEFSAKPEKVFDAWLDTDMLSKWMFGPDARDEEIIQLENTPKVGGRFSYLVKRGEEVIDHVGTFREVQRPNRLVFTWGAGEAAGEESVIMIDMEQTEN